jgi:PAS domain-containing protein
VDADGRLTTMLLDALSSEDEGSALGMLESLLAEAGIVISLREHDGRFVYASPALRGQLGDSEPTGSLAMERARFYDQSGRELPRIHHPAQEVRRSGVAIRQLVMDVEHPETGHRWILVSYLPVERGPEGWSVLAVGIDRSAVRGQLAVLPAAADAA